MSILLSPHFSYEECTFTQQRMDNTPGMVELENLKKLCNELMEPVRAILGPIRVNSAFRNLAVNTAIGGSKTSQHMMGLAMDFVPCKPMKLQDAFDILLQHPELGIDQAIFEFGRWIHLSHAYPNKAPRGQILMIGDWTGGKYKDYDASAVP